MQSFVVQSDEIEGRLDSYYYQPEFLKMQQLLNRLTYKKLNDLSNDIKNGSTPAGGIFEKAGIPYFRSQDFNLFDVEIRQFITNDFHKKLSRSAVKGGDVLIAVVGATLGVVGYTPDEINEANINQNVARVRVTANGINSKYLAIILASDIGQKQLQRNATITTQAYLNSQQLKDIKIPLPPLLIQNKIVDIMQSAYAQKKKKEAEAQRLLNSIDGYVLDELGIKLPEVEDKMCFVVSSDEVQGNRADAYYYQPRFEELKKAIERGRYGIEKLKKFITKIHYGVSIKNVYVDEGIPLLRILNLKPNKIDLTSVANLEESKRKEIGNGFIYEGDLLISRSGSVGIVAVVPKEADSFAFSSFMIKFCIIDEICKEYVSLWLNNNITKLLTEREKIGAIQGNITISTIENFLIPLSPLEIQNKIAEEVKRRISKAERLKAEAGRIIEESKKKVEGIILGED